MKTETMYATMPPWRLFFKVALPGMISMSVGTALVFPVVLLGALWSWGLDGIWFNFVGVTILTALLSVILLVRIGREIKGREKENISPLS